MFGLHVWRLRFRLALGLLLAGGLLVFLAAGQAPARAKEKAEPPTGTQIRTLLRERKFEELEAALPTSKGRPEERKGWALNLFHAFADSDPANERALSEWTESRPESPAPWLARGIYYRHMGSVSRGSRTIKHTPMIRLSQMNRFFEWSRQYLLSALQRDAHLDIAYEALINIERTGGSREWRRAIREKALATLADPIAIDFSDLYALVPKWGGTIAALREQIAQLKASHGDDPRYATLDGYADSAEADRAYMKGDHERALEKIDQALAAEKTAYRLYQRCLILQKLWRIDDAFDSLNAALELAPESQIFNLAMARLLANYDVWNKEYRDRSDEAQTYYDRAVATDPHDPNLLLERAGFHMRRARATSSPRNTLRRLEHEWRILEDLEKAKIVGEEFPEVHIALGKFYLYRMKQARIAAKHLEVALFLDPLWEGNRGRYRRALVRTSRCDTLEPLASYMHTCKRDGICGISDTFIALVEELIKQCDRTVASRPPVSRQSKITEKAKRRFFRMLESCRSYFETMDPAAAYPACRKLAEGGDSAAQFAMGLLRGVGYEGELDFKASASWFEKATAQGHAEAEAALGDLYRRGRGVRLDIAKGIALIESAVEKGSAWALYYLALAHREGVGRRKDLAKWKSLLEEAAGKGSEIAADDLKRLFPEPG